MLERCEECGYEYDLSAAAQAGEEIRVEVAELAGVLVTIDREILARRMSPELWSPLEYCCHVRDMLFTQRERVLLARRVDTPQAVPMGRDERVGHEGYTEQDPADVAEELAMAARLLTNVLHRLDPAEWELQISYNWPEHTPRTLRWLAAHTLHDVHHHVLDVQRQLEH